MILIDPELLPDSPPKSVSAKPSAGSAKAQRAKPLRLPSTRSLAQFLTQAQAAVRLRGQVTVLLTGDATMRDLNRRFRGKNKATDVLSFPVENPVQRQGKNPEKGDVAISVETALRQAPEQEHSLAIEIKVLILHGLLHLAGYDHETDAGEMKRRERSLRERLGLPLGLIERTASPTLSPKARKDGARVRKATTGPSTRSLRELAQNDKAKKASRPKQKSVRSVRS